MKRIGFKKVRHTLKGHANCSVCHPPTKSPKAVERERVRKEIREQTA